MSVNVLIQWTPLTLGAVTQSPTVAWWRHQMGSFSALLALCDGNPPVTGGFLSLRAATRSFDVFFDLRHNKLLNKQSRRWWLETPSRSLWRHCDVYEPRQNNSTVENSSDHAINFYSFYTSAVHTPIYCKQISPHMNGWLSLKNKKNSWSFQIGCHASINCACLLGGLFPQMGGIENISRMLSRSSSCQRNLERVRCEVGTVQKQYLLVVWSCDPVRTVGTLQRRHNERNGVSNHQRLDCLLNRLFRHRSRKTSKPRDTGFCWGGGGGFSVTGEFPTQRALVTRKMFPFDVVIMIRCANPV